jgi:hypothetical protein
VLIIDVVASPRLTEVNWLPAFMAQLANHSTEVFYIGAMGRLPSYVPTVYSAAHFAVTIIITVIYKGAC